MYNRFSDYLTKKYGGKTYKLPLNVPGTCPNKDGTLGTAGCVFCGEDSAGFEALPAETSIQEQITVTTALVRRKYGAKHFIAYFQNWSGTYRSLEDLGQMVQEAIATGVVAVYIATRPDCVGDDVLRLLQTCQEESGVDIVLELGLQTVNEDALIILNRGHGVAAFVDAVQRIHAHGLAVCAHMILGLPFDEMADVIAGARLLSELHVEQVKLHSLFILENTKLAELYLAGAFEMITMEAFIAREIAFLRHLSPEITVQRLLGRAPEGKALFCNWNTSWWKVRDQIEAEMLAQGATQGDTFSQIGY
ncbi:MAG: TIGR01212 family radical SAM protein [Clostridia bacterium]